MGDDRIMNCEATSIDLSIAGGPEDRQSATTLQGFAGGGAV